MLLILNSNVSFNLILFGPIFFFRYHVDRFVTCFKIQTWTNNNICKNLTLTARIATSEYNKRRYSNESYLSKTIYVLTIESYPWHVCSSITIIEDEWLRLTAKTSFRLRSNTSIYHHYSCDSVSQNRISANIHAVPYIEKWKSRSVNRLLGRSQIGPFFR